jgi:hypothetical protein
VFNRAVRFEALHRGCGRESQWAQNLCKDLARAMRLILLLRPIWERRTAIDF